MSERTNSSFTFLNFSMGIIVTFLLVWILVIGRTIILPFMVALFMTFILDPVVEFLMRIKVPRSLAVIFTMLIAFIFIYLFGLLVYSNVQEFLVQFPTYEDRLANLLYSSVNSIEHFIGKDISPDMLKNLNINWLDALQGMSLASNIVSGLGSFFSFFMRFLLMIVFLAYMLAGKPNLKRKLCAAFPETQAVSMEEMIDAATEKIQKYLGAKTLVSFITAFISLIIFWSFGVDFAVFWAFIIFLFNYIPNIGSIIASLLPVIFSILQFGSFAPAFWLLFALGILQFLMGNLLEPRIMGYSLDLSPIMVILSLIFWGYIWGVAGMLLSVPILATVAICTERIDGLRFVSVFLKGNY